MKTIKIYNTLQVTIETENNDSWTEPVICWQDAIEDALTAESPNLAQYTDCEKIHDITIETERKCGDLYGIAICEVDDDWNDEDTAQLKEYLTGQYSDGWGEGFEQREIESWIEEEEYEEYDDEEDKYYTDYYNVRYYAYVNFWQSKNFRIMTEEELK